MRIHLSVEWIGRSLVLTLMAFRSQWSELNLVRTFLLFLVKKNNFLKMQLLFFFSEVILRKATGMSFCAKIISFTHFGDFLIDVCNPFRCSLSSTLVLRCDSRGQISQNSVSMNQMKPPETEM